MGKKLKIEELHSDKTLNIAFDTLKIGKQALIFVSTKKSAESLAEKIALKVKDVKLDELSNKIEHVLSRPTKQCERLARCVLKGIAFHHSGLAGEQRELIENSFRNGSVKIICCTPTLCLSKDAKIWHGVSETEVSKLKNSQLLFVLSNNKLIGMKPQKVQENENYSKLIEISSVSGYTIKVTPQHKMFVRRKDKKLVLVASEIKKNDKIATIGYLKLENESKPKLSDFVKDNVIQSDFFIDKHLSYLIGAMLGDGYSGAAIEDKRIIYKGSPMIVGKDNEIFQNIIATSKILNISNREAISSGNVPQLILGKNKWFREFLVRSGIEQREKKHIADELMNMSLENVTFLLKGLFDTDGWVEKESNIGFSNISETLIRQMQKLLLRFGIVTYIRKRKAGFMKIYDKEYLTKEHFELLILQKKSIFDFYRYIGFNLKRKNDDLIDLVAKISSNVNYVECKNCNYKIYKDIFSGRSKEQKKWGSQKLEIIKLLGKQGELKSKEISNIIGFTPRKKDTRLNHHYFLIKKRKYGNKEWIWSLNDIGIWAYKNIINQDKNIYHFFNHRNCPLCNNSLDWIIKKGWRDSDFDGDIFWDMIRNIKEVEMEKEVYDVVLPNKPVNDHLFVANGFIVHNSMGIDMPAFRTIIRDLKRYGGRWGMDWIQVLEYHQMAGRAGRPGKEDYGEAICIAETDAEKDNIITKFINGDPEDIYSKLAVEPVLRTYVLSLVATGFVNSKKSLFDFFSKTFWAHQYKDTKKLEMILEKMINLLQEWEFLKSPKSEISDIQKPKLFADAFDFKSASIDGTLEATKLGEKVSQLYLDPYTANFIITCLRRAMSTKLAKEFEYIHMVSSTLELRPIFKPGVKDYQMIEQRIALEGHNLLNIPPSVYDQDYDEYLATIKTAIIFEEWMNENDEHDLFEKYNVRPGEFKTKLDEADWILFCTTEFCRMLGFLDLIKDVRKTQMRMKYGAKEELIALLKLRNIGRIRARTLYKNGIKDLGDVGKTDVTTLVQLLGPAIAKDIKSQIGQDVGDIVVKPNKRIGQKSMDDY